MPKERLIKNFGDKLHALRIAKNMSLQELATELGYVAHGYISELEAGKKLPTVEFVLKSARLFNVTTDLLLRDDLDIDTTE
jgi:transcriptional regulator with XRE-family HTH domain